MSSRKNSDDSTTAPTGKAPAQPDPSDPHAVRRESDPMAPVDRTPEEQVAEIESLRQKLADAEQSWLRSQADLENYRKRTRRELQEERRFAMLPIIEDLLPIVDNLQRALQVMQGGTEAAASDVQQGVQIVAQQLQHVLAKHHCHPIEAEGTSFDPMSHEAIGQEPSDHHPPLTVLRVQQHGYRLHDRIIRPAKVVVASARENA